MIEQQEQENTWYQNSILIKLSVIAVITLALLIPSSWIQDMITEREGYQEKNLAGITESWAGSQLVQGPVLMLPYKKQVTESNPQRQMITHEVIKILYVLPETLKIKAAVHAEAIRKGVYDATVYTANMVLQGSFNKPVLTNLGINPADILYDKARLVFSVSDFKGLKNNPSVSIAGQVYTPEPSIGNNIPFYKGLVVNFAMLQEQGFTFSYNLDLKGSNELSFLHTGKTTDLDFKSDWSSPAFSGLRLPDSQHTDRNGSTAQWHLLHYNRPFPQQWADNDSVLTIKGAVAEAVFGAKLQVPVDQYHKITRTAKYSALIILLTFVSLFLTEVIRKQRIHLFNYTLIGAAMVVYYTLLLSFSEQMGFNWAYLLSSAATILLIAIFTGSLLGNKAAATLFAFILSVFYGFIYVIIQLEEFSLLVGSIALFLIVATLMYFSRKINWDSH